MLRRRLLASSIDDVVEDSQLCGQVCRMFQLLHNTIFPIKTQSVYPSPHTPDRLAQLRPSSQCDLHLALLAGQRGDCKFFRKLAVPAISARISWRACASCSRRRGKINERKGDNRRSSAQIKHTIHHATIPSPIDM
jgi:hypothetical protein